ncbi:ABC transporter ATP-binding protein [Bacillus sp. JCM 19046]|nr:ABC transporter ATP-binding protein [Bacillus sp. JCM 19046]
MNIVNKLTVRNLKHNKKRTLVTMFGTIISVAMIIAVATIGVSFMDMLQRTTMQSTGEWHVSYEDVYKEQLETIEKDDLTEAVSLVKELGFAPLGEEGTDSNPYMYVREMDQEGFERFTVTLTDGRLPEAADEVVLQEEFVQLNEGRYEIGSTIQLEIGDRYTEEEGYDELDLNYWIITDSNGEVAESVQIETERDYTVVGIIEQPTWVPMWGPVYSAIGYTDRDLLSEDEQVTAMIVASQINGSIYEKAEDLEASIGNKSTFNTDLLMYHLVTGNEGFHTVIYGLLSIIIAVIVIGSVALIFNAFAISVSERSRQLGMLSSVGATKKQKRNSVFFEGFLIGIISIPIGLLAGIAGIGITFSIINGILEESFGLPEALRLVVTPTSLLIATGVSALTIFISSYIPALRASRITAIDAIRQSNDIKLSKRKVKTSKLVRSLFGMEAEIGLKNLKRNKRRYQVTVFSLMISIVLFLTVSYFTANLTRSFEMTQDEMQYDVSVYSNFENSRFIQELLENDQIMDLVNDFSFENRVNADIAAAIEYERMADRFKNQIGSTPKNDPDGQFLEDGRYPYYVELITMKEEYFERYADQIGLNLDNYQDVLNPAIVVNQITYPDDIDGQYVETDVLKTNVGDSIDLIHREWEIQELLNRQN